MISLRSEAPPKGDVGRATLPRRQGRAAASYLEFGGAAAPPYLSPRLANSQPARKGLRALPGLKKVGRSLRERLNQRMGGTGNLPVMAGYQPDGFQPARKGLRGQTKQFKAIQSNGK